MLYAQQNRSAIIISRADNTRFSKRLNDHFDALLSMTLGMFLDLSCNLTGALLPLHEWPRRHGLEVAENSPALEAVLRCT